MTLQEAEALTDPGCSDPGCERPATVWWNDSIYCYPHWVDAVEAAASLDSAAL